jgi:hypothetical protein
MPNKLSIQCEKYEINNLIAISVRLSKSGHSVVTICVEKVLVKLGCKMPDFEKKNGKWFATN